MYILLMSPERISWPEGKSFAFTIFDDPDFQTLEDGPLVYSFLQDLGFRTTKGVWPLAGPRTDHGVTCADTGVLPWIQQLQRAGFEIGYHNATTHTSSRTDTLLALERFRDFFGEYPMTISQHYLCDENIYWGPARCSGLVRRLYQLSMLGRGEPKSLGHMAAHPYFWGDLCQERIRYVRNFVFPEINTLKACPWMPYHDPARPLVNMWYASTEGARAARFLATLSEANQDRLEEEGGACIMYSHFAYGFVENGKLNPRFRELMTRLARKNGWFVPVGTMLDFLRARRKSVMISPRDRRVLERRWLRHKLLHGTA
jgi:hypothetical protein